MSAAVTMSDLAQEILTDLTEEFEGAATPRQLQKWLGDAQPIIDAAIFELRQLRLVEVRDGHVLVRLPDQRIAAAAKTRAEVLRLLRRGSSPAEVGVQLSLTKGQMACHRRVLKMQGLLA